MINRATHHSLATPDFDDCHRGAPTDLILEINWSLRLQLLVYHCSPTATAGEGRGGGDLRGAKMVASLLLEVI